MNRLAWPLAALTGTVGFLLALVLMRSDPSSIRPSLASSKADSAPLIVETAASPAPPSPGVDFAGVVSRLNAAVVNVDAATRGDSRAGGQWRRDLADGPTAPHEGT